MAEPQERASRLRVVAEGEQLTGVAPVLLERAARTCLVGDRTHRAVLRTTALLARHGLEASVPDAVRGPLLAALGLALDWADAAEAGAPQSASALRKARSEAFASVVAVERATAREVERQLTTLARATKTALDPHADEVVLRFVLLGANFASGAALLVLDGVERPPLLAGVPQQVAGALGYSAVGFGAALGPSLRRRAVERAEWEAARPAAPTSHDERALAVQLFHEFLGGAWKDQSDGHRLRLAEFVDWALEPLAPAVARPAK